MYSIHIFMFELRVVYILPHLPHLNLLTRLCIQNCGNSWARIHVKAGINPYVIVSVEEFLFSIADVG